MRNSGRAYRVSSALNSEVLSKSSSMAVDGNPVSHHAYTVVDKSFIDEYGVKATIYSHKKSGAQIMSVEAADENKVFGITFRTPPSGTSVLFL